MGKRKQFGDLYLRNFLRKTLTKDQKANFKEMFLFLNLREIRVCKLQDIKTQLEKKNNKEKFEILRNFLKYKVNNQLYFKL